MSLDLFDLDVNKKSNLNATGSNLVSENRVKLLFYNKANSETINNSSNVADLRAHILPTIIHPFNIQISGSISSIGFPAFHTSLP